MTFSPIESIRQSYDRVADAYADAIFDELRHKPFDRDLLTRFTATAGRGPVCDMGCGPGQIARFLRDAGANVFGLDLSPGMIEQARRLNPGLEFREGNMLALDLPDGSLVGIVAFYAIVNLPAELRPPVFREMARVLQPSGLLLLAFHIGGEVLGVKELWGRPITMEFYLLDRATIEAELRAAGFAVLETLERDPYPPPVEHQSRRAYIFAAKS
ncbi:MAG TPA: class I SAM-dependent methyltransferase [Terracidiphilus sp.]|jgi:SAM-dependent methyltransferase|nr:class I SAM-dependent methyltransferase [Terracidiphilus sp.]